MSTVSPLPEHPENPPAPADPKDKNRFRTWFKRLGWAGFIFFTVKGLAWLVVFYGGLRFLGCGEEG